MTDSLGTYVQHPQHAQEHCHRDGDGGSRSRIAQFGVAGSVLGVQSEASAHRGGGGIQAAGMGGEDTSIVAPHSYLAL